MRSTIRLIALVSTMGASALAAQSPAPDGPPPRRPMDQMGPGQMGPGQMREPMREGGGPAAAKMLLSNTGELELSDAQVVKLAGIARRSEGRRRSMRAAMDSAAMRFGQPGDSAARRQFGQRMRTDMERAREQHRVDQRDAIAVLTPDQQAKAWEMMANRGRAMREGNGMREWQPGMGQRQRQPMMRNRMRRPQ